MTLYRPDSPIAPISPGTSTEPSFFVQIIRPRQGLPVGGLVPPRFFGVDAQLGFDSKSKDATFILQHDRLDLAGAGWDVRLSFDVEGQAQTESEIVFELVFQDQPRRLRCKSGSPTVGEFQQSQIAPNEFSGLFEVEFPNCEDAETRQPLGWPPRPFVLRGSYDRLPRADSPKQRS